MKFKNQLFILLAIIILTLAACDNSDDSSDELSDNDDDKQVEVTTITLAGEGYGAVLLTDLEADFKADNPSHDLNILTGVSTVDGIKGISEGLLDVAIMTRPPTTEELEATPSLVYIPLGKVGIAILAHPNTSINSLTIIEVFSVFGGAITNWSKLDGPDEDIILFLSDLQEGVEEAATGTSVLALLPEDFAFPETAITVTNAVDLISSIESTEHSIGFDLWAGAGITQSEIKTIQLNGVGPTEASYPLTTPFSIGYLADNADTVQVFVDWLNSEAGQNALRDLGVILE